MLNTRSFLRELLFVSGYNFIFFFLACDVLHPQVEIGDAEVLLPWYGLFANKNFIFDRFLFQESLDLSIFL